MTEGLQINLSMQGVQQALGSINQLKDSLGAMHKNMSALGKLNIAATVAANAGSVFTTFRELSNAMLEWKGEYDELLESMGGLADNPLNAWSAGWGAFQNMTNKAEINLEKEIDLRSKLIDIDRKTIELRMAGERVRGKISGGSTGVEDGFSALSKIQDDILTADLKALDLQATAAQAKLDKAVTGMGVLLATKELQEINARKALRLLQEQADTGERLDEERAEAKKRADNLLQVTIQSEGRLLKLKQDQFDVDQAMLQANFRLPEVVKRDTLLEMLTREKQVISDQVAILKKRRDALGARGRISLGGSSVSIDSNNSQNRELLQGQIDQISHRGLGIDQQLAGVLGQADPHSFGDQFAEGFKRMRDEWGTLQKQIADGFFNTGQSAISATSNAMTGLILGTKRWKDALAEVGTTILTSVIQSITQMIAKLLVIKTLSLFIPGGSLLGVKLFAKGGYTGDGPVNSVAGIVHRGEYVIPAPQVSRIGVGNIESAMAGLGGGGSQNIAFFDDGSKLSDWARTQEGETVIVDVVRRNLHRFGQA